MLLNGHKAPTEISTIACRPGPATIKSCPDRKLKFLVQCIAHRASRCCKPEAQRDSEVRNICLRKCRAVRNVSPESRISVSCWRWQEGGGAGVDEKPPEHPMTSGAPSTDSDLALVRIGQLRCPTCSCPLLRWNLVALTKYFTEQGELHGLLRARR